MFLYIKGFNIFLYLSYPLPPLFLQLFLFLFQIYFILFFLIPFLIPFFISLLLPYHYFNLSVSLHFFFHSHTPFISIILSKINFQYIIIIINLLHLKIFIITTIILNSVFFIINNLVNTLFLSERTHQVK